MGRQTWGLMPAAVVYSESLEMGFAIACKDRRAVRVTQHWRLASLDNAGAPCTLPLIPPTHARAFPLFPSATGTYAPATPWPCPYRPPSASSHCFPQHPLILAPHSP
eukprot:13848-Chlamydomonas_euryale.AAC.1